MKCGTVFIIGMFVGALFIHMVSPMFWLTVLQLIMGH
jgi:hypothetical protein